MVTNGNFKLYYKKTSTSTPVQVGSSTYAANSQWLGNPTAYYNTPTQDITLNASNFNSTGGTFYSIFITDIGATYNSNSYPVELTYSAIANNSISSNHTVFSGYTAALLTGSLPTGGSNVYTYQWQQSSDNSSFTNIGGATSQNYQPSAISATTYYRRLVNSANVTQSISNVVTVYTQATTNTIISNYSNVCPSRTSVFLTISTAQSPGLTYQWQTVGCDGVTAQDIAGATSSAYATPYVASHYRLKIGCSGSYVYSNILLITQSINCAYGTSPCPAGPGGGGGGCIECRTSAVAGIDGDEATSDFMNIFPNPNNAQFTLSLIAAEDHEATITIVNILGKEVYKESRFFNKGENQFQIKMEDYSKGVYFVRIQNAERQLQMKMIYQ